MLAKALFVLDHFQGTGSFGYPKHQTSGPGSFGGASVRAGSRKAQVRVFVVAPRTEYIPGTTAGKVYVQATSSPLHGSIRWHLSSQHEPQSKGLWWVALCSSLARPRVEQVWPQPSGPIARDPRAVFERRAWLRHPV